MPNDNTETNADSPNRQPQFQRPVVDETGDFLLHSPGTRSLENVSVKEFKLNVSPGVQPDESTEQFTASARYWLDQEHGTPVAQAGQLRVISMTDLSRSVNVKGRSVSPEFVRHRTLDPSNPGDNDDLKQFVQSALRRAIPDSKYSFRFLNDIVREKPAFTAKSGQFAAHPKYDLRVRITEDGVPLLHIESGHTLRAAQTIDEMIDQSDDPGGLRVEHDTTRYQNPGSGVLLGWSEAHYTDHLDEVGNSIYALHEGAVDTQLREELRRKNPRLLRIRYGNQVRYQLPQLLRLSPRLEQIEQQDPQFYRRYNTEKGLLPQTRVTRAQNFIADLQPLPVLEIEFQPRLTNHGYQLLDLRESRTRLAFGAGTRHTQPRNGLVEAGVFQSPGRYRVGVLTPETQSFKALGDQFLPLLVNGLREIDAPAAVKHYTYELGEVSSYTQAAYNIEDDTAVTVAIVPDEQQADLFDGIEDPFHELKRALMRKGIPTQMVMKSTVDKLVSVNASADNHSFINILSAIVAKAGGTPCQIANLPGPTDAFMGLDVTRNADNQHAGASASVVLNNGAVFAAESTTLQSGETFRTNHIEQFVRDLVHEFASKGNREINHLTILRDGKIPEQVDTIREGIEKMGISFDMVGIRKSGQPRIAAFDGTAFQISRKGLAFVDETRGEAILHPWGIPETTQANHQGTPRTLGIIKDSGPTPLPIITEQVYWLTEMHFGSPSRSTREPVPIKYADAAAEYVRKGFVAPGELIHGPAYL